MSFAAFARASGRLRLSAMSQQGSNFLAMRGAGFAQRSIATETGFVDFLIFETEGGAPRLEWVSELEGDCVTAVRRTRCV